MDHDGGVEEAALEAQRRADDEHRKEAARSLDELVDGALDGVEQRVLEQEIVDRVGRQAQFGKDHQRGVKRIAFAREPQGLGEVGRHVGDPHARHAGGDADEVVGVERIELGGHRRHFKMSHSREIARSGEGGHASGRRP